MNKLDKERKEKIKKEIQDDLKLAKIEAEIRKRNEQQIKSELGVKESLSKFHEPVIEMLKAQDETRKSNLKALEEAIHDISIPPLESSRIIPELKEPELGDSFRTMYEGVHRINLDKDLDLSFIKEMGLELPSELVNRSEDELNQIIKYATNKNKEIGYKKGPIKKQWRNESNDDRKLKLERRLNKFDYKLDMIRKYIKAVKTLKEGNYYIGEGIDRLDLLDKLTDKICNGSKNKKLHNQIVSLLDILLKNGEISDEQVKQYYKQFLIS